MSETKIKIEMSVGNIQKELLLLEENARHLSSEDQIEVIKVNQFIEHIRLAILKYENL